MEAAHERDEVLPSRGEAGQLDGRLDRLGAGVADEAAGGPVDRRDLVELCRQLRVDRQVEVGGAEVDQVARLALDRLGHARVGVAGR